MWCVLFRVDGVGLAVGARRAGRRSCVRRGRRSPRRDMRGPGALGNAARRESPCILVISSPPQRRVLLPPRETREQHPPPRTRELPTTDGAHVTCAADGCPLPEPRKHVGAKPGAHLRLPFTPPRTRGGYPEQSKQRRGCPCDRD